MTRDRRATMNPTGNTILITGGGSGIGRELARRFHDLGNIVIVAGRRTSALDETIAGRDGMHAVTLDVEDSAAVTAFAAQVIRDHPALNVLINNAGVMRTEDRAAPRDLHDAEETIVTNLLGPIRLIDAFVGQLDGRSGAAIVNVSSGLAFVPLARAATYSATKAALHSYTVSLRHVLRGRIEVIELAPPAVQTDLTPGQATHPAYMPLNAFIDEVMTLFAVQPTPAEILVENVRLIRSAESSGRFDDLLRMVNSM
jgi:uncharacterized oxidoreductase